MERTKPVDNHINREGLLLRETVNKVTRPITVTHSALRADDSRCLLLTIITRRMRVTVLEKMKEMKRKWRGILLFGYFWKETREKNLGKQKI